MSYFAVKLRERMESIRLTQQDLAFDIRVDTGLLSKVLNGRLGAPESLLHKLASYKPLNVNYDEMKVWQVLDRVEPAQIPWLKKEIEDIK